MSRSDAEQTTIDTGRNCLAHLMKGADGGFVKAYLLSLEQRVFAANATEAELRDANAKRALIHSLCRLQETPTTPEQERNRDV